MIRINQIKLPIDHKEAAFEKKIKKALHNTESMQGKKKNYLMYMQSM